MKTLRLLLNRMLGRKTLLDFDLLGTRLSLAIEARREIRRAKSIAKDAALVQRILESLREEDVVYDVGANIGLIGLLIACDEKGVRSQVHCFEPEPRNYEQLCRNIAENRLTDRVHAHRIALGDAATELDLYVRGRAGEGRHSTVVSAGSTGSLRIPAQTLSGFAKSCGTPPQVIKIDVEGAEGRVLAGMEQLLASHRPREIFLELHDKGEADRMPQGGSIDEWLQDRGYTLEWQEERGRSRHCHYR